MLLLLLLLFAHISSVCGDVCLDMALQQQEAALPLGLAWKQTGAVGCFNGAVDDSSVVVRLQP